MLPTLPSLLHLTCPTFKATSRSALNPKRLQTGLFDGRSRQTGNAIGETYNSKTRRTWQPNSQTKAVWSEALGRKLRLRVTTGALRTLDKVGGLDAYLFRMTPERLGARGLELRQMVKDAHAEARKKAQVQARREALMAGSSAPKSIADIYQREVEPPSLFGHIIRDGTS